MPPLPALNQPDRPAPKPGSLAERIRLVDDLAAIQPTAAADPPRLRLAILGAPDDLGVSLNNGRPGAAGGPAAIRQALARFGLPFDSLLRRDPLDRIDIVDAGDIAPTAAPADAPHDEREAALLETHQQLRAVSAHLHQLGLLTLGLGGGHDLTLPMVQGLHNARYAEPGAVATTYTDPTNLGGVNIDAHLDVRETVGSGMPFRRLIETGALAPERFTVIGAGRFASSPEHVRWLELDCNPARGGARVLTIDEARGVGVGNLFHMRMEEALRRAHLLGEHHRPGFVTFDLDAVDASAAPGVSAVNPNGLSTAEACRAAELAGIAPGVAHFDVMELNPAFDADGRTARLAATLVLHFIAGLAQREGVAHDPHAD